MSRAEASDNVGTPLFVQHHVITIAAQFIMILSTLDADIDASNVMARLRERRKEVGRRKRFLLRYDPVLDVPAQLGRAEIAIRPANLDTGAELTQQSQVPDVAQEDTTRPASGVEALSR